MTNAMHMNMKGKTKAQIQKDKVLSLLDQEDAKIAALETNHMEKSEFSQLFEDSLTSRDYNVGDIVNGTVVDIREDYVLVDINYKSEGLIPLSEFRIVEGKSNVEKGMEVEVFIDKIENDNGMIVLSKDKADMLRVWNDLSRASESGEVVKGTVIAKVKGGLSVDIGVKAFLPGSQIDLRPVRNMDGYIGNTYEFKVIKFNKRRGSIGNIVLSRRAILEEERESLRSQTMDSMAEGSLVRGIVKNITDYGAFIDLGGMDGLLHITDMSWGRVKHPSEVLKVGEEIDVKVLKFDNEKERVSLGLKQMKADPWDEVMQNYPKGRKLEGKVISLADYGAFVELDEGIEGLIHVSEMSWTKKIKHPSQMLNVGDRVNVVVIDLDTENRRISLGMKQLEENPWNEMKETYAPGTVIEGEVKSITDFGVFIGIEEGIDGLVHISDLSWTKRINHPSELFKKGDKVRAVVLGVDVENERFSLGVKQLESDPWSKVEDKYPIGTQLDVKVVKTADFGVFVELEPEIEGLIHISELSLTRVEKTDDFAKAGDIIRAEVLTIDRDAKKIGLSAKLVKMREQKADVDDYVKKATSTSKTSFGEIFGQQFKNASSKEDGQS